MGDDTITFRPDSYAGDSPESSPDLSVSPASAVYLHVSSVVFLLKINFFCSSCLHQKGENGGWKNG